MDFIDFTSYGCFWTIFCFVLFIIQLCYIFGVYARVFRTAKRQNAASDGECELPPLSVIVVTKDSGNMLKEYLPKILEQDYPCFEVIVINDKSAGEDEDVLKLLAGKYNNLYHTFIPESARYVSRKKLGVAMGIRASKYDWVVMTEPYCYPSTKNWLRSMACQMKPETDIVLGYCNYESGKGWFAKRITVSTLFRAMRYLGMALAGHPYMGVGCNMAYRKKVYESHKGFADHLQLRRGEDDLFVNAVAKAGNTRVAVSSDSIMRMPVPPFKRIWHEEKMNAMVTAKYYRGIAPYLNAIDSWTCGLFHLLTVVAIAFCLIEQQWVIAGIALGLWLIRFICAMTVYRLTSKAMRESLCCVFPLFDLFRPLWSLTRRAQYLFRRKSDFMRR